MGIWWLAIILVGFIAIDMTAIRGEVIKNALEELRGLRVLFRASEHMRDRSFGTDSCRMNLLRYKFCSFCDLQWRLYVN